MLISNTRPPYVCLSWGEIMKSSVSCSREMMSQKRSSRLLAVEDNRDFPLRIPKDAGAKRYVQDVYSPRAVNPHRGRMHHATRIPCPVRPLAAQLANFPASSILIPSAQQVANTSSSPRSLAFGRGRTAPRLPSKRGNRPGKMNQSSPSPVSFLHAPLISAAYLT